MNSSCGSSIGNRRISSRYRVRPVSPDKMGNAAIWAMTAPSIFWPPRSGRRTEPSLLEPMAPVHHFAPATYTVESAERKGNGITSPRCQLDFRSNGAENPRKPYRQTTQRQYRSDSRPAHYANGQGRAAVPIGTQGFRRLTGG